MCGRKPVRRRFGRAEHNHELAVGDDGMNEGEIWLWEGASVLAQLVLLGHTIRSAQLL
jgi:hypothetical protein